MRTLELKSLDEFIGDCTAQALHLGMRDAYVPSAPSFRAFTGESPAYDRTQRETEWHPSSPRQSPGASQYAVHGSFPSL